MVSILPSGTPGSLISADVGRALQSVLPQALNQGYQRGMGLNAIDQLQQDLAASGGDISKMLPSLARAYTLNPNLERSGLGQFAMQQSKVNRAFPEKTNASSPQISENAKGNALPSPFNIQTSEDIDRASEEYARAINDPAGYNTRQSQLNNLNQIANAQRGELEEAAKGYGVSPEDVAKFMIAGKDFDTRNVPEWLEKTNQKFKEYKNNLAKLNRAFLPGIGNALLGQNRDKALKNIEPTVKDLVDQGYEDDVRTFLANEYLSPTEIENAIRPLTPEKNKAISKLPKGKFPAHKTEALDIFSLKPPLKYPLGSFEEAQITHPKELEKMQSDLSNFFLKNIDENTALLPMVNKIWEDKDYDWQQFGPAIQQAVSEGLKLSPRQKTELTDIETQPPRQSLPDIFKSWDRIIQYFRGNK